MTLVEEYGLGELDPAGERTPITMRDGVVLHGDLYRAARQMPSPTILIRLPYGTARGYTYMPQVGQYLAERGFNALVQDVRGRFRSGGDRTPAIHEVDDAYDTIDWVSKQGWCNGAVGVMGNSYYGFTTWAAAGSEHPALKAIVPRYTSQLIPPRRSFERDAIASAPRSIEWIVSIWSTETMIEVEDLGIDLLGVPLREAIPESLANARRIVQERLDEGEDSFAQRVYPNGLPAGRLKIPALHVVGWWDNLKSVQMPDWDEASTSAPAREHQFMLAGAVDHRDVHFSLTGRAQDDHLHGDDEALRRYLPRMLDLPIAFFKHYLAGGEGVWPGPKVRYELTNAGWRADERWPPPARGVTLHLTDGRLTAEPADDEESTSWIHDPLNPVPELTPNDYEILLEIPDETTIHERDDVTIFTAEPLDAPIDIVGRPTLQVTIDAESPSTHVIATLCDIDQTGRGWLISEGAERVDTSSGPAGVTVTLGDLAYRVLPGHRLRLAIQSSRFARYTVHPGNGEDVWESGTRTRARQTLHVGGEHGGALRLPLVDAEGVA